MFSLKRKSIELSRYFFPLLILNYIFIIASRVLEFCLINKLHEVGDFLFTQELVGLVWDFALSTLIFLMISPLFIIKRMQKVIAGIFLFFLLLWQFAHYLIVNYFLYNLTPLDSFLYSHTLDEILFTVQTADVNPKIVIFLGVGLMTVFLLLFRRLKMVCFGKRAFLLFLFFLISSPVVLFLVENNSMGHKFRLNKTVFFVQRSVQYFLIKNSERDLELKSKLDFHLLYPNKRFIDTTFILLSERDTSNSISKYFEQPSAVPSVVILIVEGLNNDFINSYYDLELMPFLTQLKSASLYWENCFTLGERSFAVVPSITGGLPYGQKGFTFIENYPRHLSLVSQLKESGFGTSFFYGQGSWFHKKDKYFRYNNIDRIIDYKKYNSNYKKIVVGDYFWGYNDKDLFRNSLEVIDSLNVSPSLDMYFTGTSHPPYKFPEEEKYIERLNLQANDVNKEFLRKYEKYLSSLLFVDDALKNFFNQYKNKPNYKNTIFVITGDHPCTELPRKNVLKRYHVPLLIYSPLIKTPKTFGNVVSHLDVSETILNILTPYLRKKPSKYTASLGSTLVDTLGPNNRRFAFMDSNRDLIDFYSQGYFISGNKLFYVGENFEIKKIENKKKYDELKHELEVFKASNLHVCSNNKIVPREIFLNQLGFTEILDTSMKRPVETTDEWGHLIPDLRLKNASRLDMEIELGLLEFGEDLEVILELNRSSGEFVYWHSTKINTANSKVVVQAELQGRGADNMILKVLIRNPERKNLKYIVKNINLQAKL